MSERVRAVLSPVISWIDDGKVRFRRVGQVWEVDYRTPSDPLPPPQDRLVWAAIGMNGRCTVAMSNIVSAAGVYRRERRGWGAGRVGGPRTMRRARPEPRD